MQPASKVKPFETVVLSVVKTSSLSWHRRCHPPLCLRFPFYPVASWSFLRFFLVVQVSCNVYRPKEALRRWIVYIIVNGFLWLKQIILLCNLKLIGQNLGRCTGASHAEKSRSLSPHSSSPNHSAEKYRRHLGRHHVPRE